MFIVGIVGCEKEKEIINLSNHTKNQKINIQNISTSSLVEVSESIIKEVKDSLALPYWQQLLTNVGDPLWDCTKVTLENSITKVVVPYLNPNSNEIDFLLIGYKSPSNQWRVGLINKYHYELLVNTTKNYPNFLFYDAMLREFSQLDKYCNSGIPTSSHIESNIETYREVEVVATITFGDGTVWTYYSDGSISVMSGSGPSQSGSGCGGWDSGLIMWMDGRSFEFPADNDNKNEGFEKDPFNWNDRENKDFTCGWCPEEGRGGVTNNSDLLCLTSAFWEGSDPKVKKAYINALSDLLNQNDIHACHKPFPLDQPEEGCEIFYEDILCGAYVSNCFIGGGTDYNGFYECLSAVLLTKSDEPTIIPSSKECKKMAFQFLFEYDIDMSIYELSSAMGGFGDDCRSQSSFDEMACTFLIDDRISNLGDLAFPCEDMSTEDILADMAADACPPTPGVSPLDAFDEALEAVDKIIVRDKTTCEGETMSDDCPKLKNLIDQLVGGDSSRPNCDLLKDLGASDNITVHYKWDCDNSKITASSDGSLPLGQTKFPDLGDNEISIYFNKNICDKSCEEIMSVILHESIHAKIQKLVLDELTIPDPENGDISTIENFKDEWDKIVLKEFDGITHHHEIMAKYYAYEFAEAMRQMNGGDGDVEDYLYWAYKGLGVEAFANAGHPLLENSKWEEYQNNWNSSNLEIKCD